MTDFAPPDAAEFLSPVLDAAKARYLTQGLDSVQGWLVPSTALYLAGIETAQRGRTAAGICEIGVHRGKSFMTLVIDLPPGESAVAIDVFDLQHLNEDGTSVNARQDFETNLDTWGVRDRVKVVQGSSLELEAEGFLEAGKRFRLFSIDGGHGAQFVVNDLRLAEATMVTGGIVALDDIFNTHWLGVVTGFFDYIHSGGTLRPFALVPNKLLLTDPDNVEANRALMREQFSCGQTKADIPLAGSFIDRYDDIAWVVRGVDGTAAPLQRPANDLATVRAELAGVVLDRDRLRKSLRQAESQRDALRRKLAAAKKQAAANSKAAAMRAAAPARSPLLGLSPARAAQLKKRIPRKLLGPARAAYRAVNDLQKPKVNADLE